MSIKERRYIMENTRLERKLCEMEGELIDDHEVYINGAVANLKIFKYKGDFYLDVKLDNETVFFHELRRKAAWV